MVRPFIWRSSGGTKKIALVGWDSIYQPKSHGGLGIRSLRDHSTSFMIKLSFNVVSDSPSLWVSVLLSRYGVQNGLPETLLRAQSYFLWIFRGS